MEKSSPKVSWEQDFTINAEVDQNKHPCTKSINSIEVPDLILRDSLRIVNSNYINID